MSEAAQTPDTPTSPAPIGRRIKKILPWFLFLLVVGGAIFVYVRYERSHKPAEVEFKTVAVERKKIVGRVTASGTLQAVVTVQVGSQVSGRIQHLYADFNSTVTKGELIAKIDPLLFQANVEQANANYVSSKAGVAQAVAKEHDAQLTLDRTKALSAQSLASEIDLQTANTNLALAKAGVEVAKAALDQAQAQLNQNVVNLSYTSIFSPIDGVVISRSVDVGQTVAASLQAPVLFTIAEDLKKMQVNTNIAEGDVGRLQPDMPTYFTVNAFPGQRFQGKISQIRNAAQILQNVVTYDAVIDVDNSELKLRPGMTANVTIIYDTRDHALAVPNAALRFRPPPNVASASLPAAPSGSASGATAPSGSAHRQHGGGGGSGGAGRKHETADPETRTIWLLRSGKAVPITIKAGLSDGSTTEVASGDVNEGDLVVTDATVNGGAPTGTTAPTGGTRRLF